RSLRAVGHSRDPVHAHRARHDQPHAAFGRGPEAPRNSDPRHCLHWRRNHRYAAHDRELQRRAQSRPAAARHAAEPQLPQRSVRGKLPVGRLRRMSTRSPSPVWHPFTQHALQPDATLVLRGEGAWLEAAGDRRILDAISSWWVVTHGHRNARIIAAIKAQADKLDQVIFAGYTHEPAELLARKLIDIAPANLAHVFFSDSGSTSVEVAVKMARGFWRNRGEARTRIVAREHAYHGDTIGTMSAGARGVFNAAYEPLLFDVVRVPFPRAGHEQE